MFKRLWENLPKDPQYPADFDNLGYRFNAQGQLVGKNSDEFFDYFHTDNERVNDTRKEAVHESVRGRVKEELADLDVKEYYLTGHSGREIYDEKPDMKHVNILVTDREALKKKIDVILVVPDQNQDLGILTYRELLGAGGIERGSILGLVHKLQTTSLSGDEVR